MKSPVVWHGNHVMDKLVHREEGREDVALINAHLSEVESRACSSNMTKKSPPTEASLATQACIGAAKRNRSILNQ